MALIQKQRLAIESLYPGGDATPPQVPQDTNELFDSAGTRLYVAGVSQGVGTNSTLHGVDVLVLTQSEVWRDIKLGERSCAYTVLVRTPTDEERAADTVHHPDVARGCVELLEPRLLEDGTPIFARTGQIAVYPAII